MPNPATLAQPQTAGGTSQGTQQRGGDGRAVVPVVPFIRASAQHREPAGIDVSKAITTSDQDLGVFDIPAYGYVRSILLLVTTSGGTGTSVAGNEDAPFNVLKNLAFTEPNGSVINQFNSGYDLFVVNKYGGYRNSIGADPKASPIFSAIAAATGHFAFALRIPIEMNMRDALGSLPNQNSAATFKLRMALARSADVYSTAPSTLPTVRVRAFLEAWDQPEVNSSGQTNQVTPPAMNTTQFWTAQEFNVEAGQQTIRLTRVGNYIRNLIFVLRRSGTSRANGHSDLPDPLTLFLDSRPLDTINRESFLNQMYERSGYGGAVGTEVPANDSARGLDNGVFVYDLTHEFNGTYGMENRDLWIPTLGSTRLELQGNFANAGRLTVLTNDIAISGSVFI